MSVMVFLAIIHAKAPNFQSGTVFVYFTIRTTCCRLMHVSGRDFLTDERSLMTGHTFPVLLARHPALNGVAGRCYGRLDIPLAAGWEEGATLLAERLLNVGCEVIHSSPSSRCLSISRYLAARTHREVVVDPRLAELDFGLWEGMLWDEVPRDALDRWGADPKGFAPPKGESGQALIARVQSYWADFVCKKIGTCVVSHGGPLRLFKGLACGQTPDLLAPSMSLGTAELFNISLSA